MAVLALYCGTSVLVFGGGLVSPACGYDSLAGDTRRIPGQ